MVPACRSYHRSRSRESDGRSSSSRRWLADSRQPGRRAQIIDPTQWPLALFSSARATVTKALIGLLIATTFVVGSGCAKQDWIDRTLVTVDVTGTWSGTMMTLGSGGAGGARDVVFELEQRGSTVKGTMRVTRLAPPSAAPGYVSIVRRPGEGKLTAFRLERPSLKT
jgi:hypothetical protein